MYVDRPAVDEPDRARHSIPRPQSDKLLEQTFAGKPTHMLARAGNGYRRSRPAEDLRKLPNPSLSFRKGLQFPSFPLPFPSESFTFFPGFVSFKGFAGEWKRKKEKNRVCSALTPNRGAGNGARQSGAA